MKKLFFAFAIVTSTTAFAGTETYFDHCLGDYVTYTTQDSEAFTSYFDACAGCIIDASGNCAS